MKVLKSQQLIEKDTVTLACELDDAAGEVKWLKNGEEIVPDKRVQVVKDGRKRKLVLKDAKVTDAGEYSCVSNADKTQAEIVINCKYIFLTILICYYFTGLQDLVNLGGSAKKLLDEKRKCLDFF